ncbi:enoyl-CoA hydratase [Alteribacillus bidgolensis]|uniref:Short chain enoyl-CoA hydratase n=1 Tax=Alteribacillus bidgolensis TaxID=930129 RepID=A0A1G8N1Z4_9BACI|nr:enoyl-CoA hydratase [Alteribacillus bidgolensis]SDI74204.1 short chain enoyl-CoA hydratase [Alteribacillus bidgolensis]
MTRYIRVDKPHEGITVITLNRPSTANALSISLLNKLQETLKDLAYDASCRVLIIRGEGEKVFCAGADLKERANMNQIEVRKTVSFIKESINRIENFPKPVIAAMNGSALGGGLELALACDLRIASADGKYGLPETSLAIIPGGGGTQLLPRLIGKAKAKELIYTARKISGKEAVELGIAEYAAESGHVFNKAVELALEIRRNGPVAVSAAKTAINGGIDSELTTGLVIEEKSYEATISTEDRLEGLRAFKEKREPVYYGK